MKVFAYLFVAIQTEEDQQLKEKLDLLSERVRDVDPAQQRNALKMIKTEISGATATMTSVPKPLKFLIPHYTALKEYYES